MSARASFDLQTLAAQFQGGASGVAALLETAPPQYYFLYLIAAGFGVPCSEDALVVWVGSRLWLGHYGGGWHAATVLATVYLGVVLSDWITYGMGTLLHRGFFSRFKDSLAREGSGTQRAIAAVQKHGRSVGVLQRFSVGFRGPLCIASGLSGVPFAQFAGGAAIGALGTMPLQLGAGWLMRNTPTPPGVYLAVLALAAGPQIVGNYAATAFALLAGWRSQRVQAAARPQN
ncbi:hypothetical protein WJX81_003116 [Elliptochloris bilobata]|uniref:VTT domain-containing protein n=1 Tax=Elliptochloris bilobata TaxID=381761 RepID=A0AAW1S8T3_9CHLO